MTAIRPILRAFVTWMESSYGTPSQGATSEFAVEPSDEIMTMAELALASAVTGQRPVLFSADVPERSIIAALVLRRAGVTRAQLYQGSFSDEQFEELTDAVRTVKLSKLIVGLPAEKVGADASATH